MLKIFKNPIQYESSKIVNYIFVSQKLVDEKMKRMAQKLLISKFFKSSETDDDIYNYRHENGKISQIDLGKRCCSCTLFFDKGMCVHLARVAMMEEASLPGMDEVKKLTVRRIKKK